jgi:hypothetical protein
MNRSTKRSLVITMAFLFATSLVAATETEAVDSSPPKKSVVAAPSVTEVKAERAARDCVPSATVQVNTLEELEAGDVKQLEAALAPEPSSPKPSAKKPASKKDGKAVEKSGTGES